MPGQDPPDDVLIDLDPEESADGEGRKHAKHKPLVRAEIWGPLPRPGDHEKLLLQQQVLGEEGSCSARPGDPGQCGHQVNQQKKDGLHTPESRLLGPAGQD